MSIELKVEDFEGFLVITNQNKVQEGMVVHCIPELYVSLNLNRELYRINVEICHDVYFWDDEIKGVLSANIIGLYSISAFGWLDCSAVEIFILALLYKYGLSSYDDWFDLLPDKGEKIKKYLNKLS